jgi:hypothetical protein
MATPSQIFFMINETGIVEAIIILRPRIPQPLPPILVIIQSLCATPYFALKRPMPVTSRALSEVFSALEN